MEQAYLQVWDFLSPHIDSVKSAGLDRVVIVDHPYQEDFSQWWASKIIRETKRPITPGISADKTLKYKCRFVRNQPAIRGVPSTERRMNLELFWEPGSTE